MIKRAALYSIDSGKFETAKRLVDFYEENGALDKTLKNYRIRAFISLGEYDEAEGEIDRNWEDFSEMERVRFKLQIGCDGTEMLCRCNNESIFRQWSQLLDVCKSSAMMCFNERQS